MNRFDVSDPQAWPGLQGVDLERNTPARPAAIVADLLVPVGQAVVTGALIAGLAAYIVRQVWPDWPGVWRLWVGLALAIAAAAWLVLLGQTRRLLWIIERLTGRDLDGDRAIGEPQERLVIVNASRGQEQAAQRAQETRASQFAQFVAELGVRGTTLRAWEKHIGRERYQEYRDLMLRVGWAHWNSTRRDGSPNERRGWSLTMAAEEILERIE